MSFPITIKQYNKKFLLGLVKIDYLVENRRPDLAIDDYIYPGKYKHYIDLTVFFKRYNWTFRTQYPYEELPYTS